MDENTLKNIIKTRKIIQKKYRDLQMDNVENKIFLEDTFEPITKQLKVLIEKDEAKPSKNNSIEKKYVSSTPYKSQKPLFDTTTGTDEFATPNFEDSFVHEPKIEEISTKKSNTSSLDSSVLNLSKLQKENVIDNTYGPYKISNTWKIGSKTFQLNKDDIFIDDNKYKVTPGLLQLIIYKKPRDYDANDLKVYKEILALTNAHKRNNDPNQGMKGSRAYKYTKIIKNLFKSEKNTTFEGQGLMQTLKKPNYIYWNDPNELVERLKLLLSSQSAGHNNHNNEIVSIIEELREANIII